MSTNKLATAALAGLMTLTMMGAGSAFAAEGAEASATPDKAVAEKASCKGQDKAAEKASCKGKKAEHKSSCKSKASCKGKDKAEAPAAEAPAEAK